MSKLTLTKKYGAYPKYKKSGIEWWDSIPSDWNTSYLRAVATPNQEKNLDGRNENLLSLSYGRIIEKDIHVNGGLLPASFNTYQIVHRGDIVMRLTDLQNDKKSLRVGYVGADNGIITSAYTALKLKEGNFDRYLYYLLHAYDLQKVFYNLGGGVRQSLDYKSLKYLPVILPSVTTQKAIVSFLDEKTTTIDYVIEKKKRQIELLKEKRAAVINHAVTKGLNPKAKLASTGMGWIGEIPESWSLISLGKILDYIQPGNYIAKDIVEENGDEKIPVLTANKGFLVGYTKEKEGIFKSPLPVIIFDDFTTSKKFVDQPFKVRSSALKILKLKKNAEADIRFVFRCMEVLDFHTLEHNRHWIGMYRRQSIPFPPLSVQNEIAVYLDKQDEYFQDAFALLNKSIGLLEEFKSSLISHVVTGKIKV